MFVSFSMAHAFQNNGHVLVYRPITSMWDEPSPKECERNMGFHWGTTRHPQVIKFERNTLFGIVMDLNAITWSMVTCFLYQMYAHDHTSTLSSHEEMSWHPHQYTRLFIASPTSWLLTRGVPWNFVVCEVDEEPSVDIMDTMESPQVTLLDVFTCAFILVEQLMSSQQDSYLLWICICLIYEGTWQVQGHRVCPLSHSWDTYIPLKTHLE